MELKIIKINSHILKIIGGAELPCKIDDTNYAIIKGEIGVYEVSRKNNENGSYDLIYKAKFTSNIEVEQGEKKIIAKNKNTKSQQMRRLLWAIANSNGEDGDAYYDIIMDKIMVNIDEVINYLKNK
jgi:hypothetical protein